MKKQFLTWKINKHDSGKKLLIFLREKLKLSNKQIKKALDKGLLKLNGKIERFSSIRLKQNDTVQFLADYKKKLSKEVVKSFKIIYEDESLLSIDKPINFISTDDNIHNYFKEEYTLVHRLDKDTSGVLLIAKNIKAKEKMKTLFSKKEIDKYYLAIVDGKVNFKEKKIETYLTKEKSIDGQTIYTTSNNGKYSLTYIETLETKQDYSLLLIKPVTGRTHQIRVHLKKIGHPVLGDFLYAKKFRYQGFVDRMMLHSFKMAFLNPFTEEDLEIKTDIPTIFFKYFENIKKLF